MQQEKADLEERKSYYLGFTQGRIGDRPDGANDAATLQGTNLTFIPAEPRKYYLDLLRRCLDLDLDDMANLSDTDMVSLAILSEPHIALLDEIAGHWRISKATKLTAHASLLVDLLREDGVPVECVAEALTKLRHYVQQADKQLWLRQDVSRWPLQRKNQVIEIKLSSGYIRWHCCLPCLPRSPITSSPFLAS